ncbi:MAG: hypothetical protein HC895_20085 [Leptolyngbyaceae cyanobacterium SM1_3_5]|nr:hypothetical protein [Leptolyngbyaceae cyanobacterium SM1_3_5]
MTRTKLRIPISYRVFDREVLVSTPPIDRISEKLKAWRLSRGQARDCYDRATDFIQAIAP